MKNKITILAFLLAVISFGGGIPTPPIDEELSPQTRNYFKTLYDNHNKFEVTTTNPNGNRLGSRGDTVLLRTGTSYDLYTCISSPSGTVWIKTNQMTDEKTKASSSDATADYLDGKVAKSVVVTSNKLELSGDSASPGNLKVYGTDGSGVKGWQSVSGLSNVIFQWTGQVDQAAADRGAYLGTSIVANSLTHNYLYLVTNQTSNDILLRSKWVKIAGVSTLTIWCKIWQSAAAPGQATARVDVGTTNVSVAGTAGQQTPEWVSTTLDVSGLTNGSTYDVTVGIRHAAASYAYLGAVVIFGS